VKSEGDGTSGAEIKSSTGEPVTSRW
jgi:hypothetical protein